MGPGLSFDKLLIILVIALFLIGPERLPRYAAQLGRLARSVRDMANGAKDRMREEMGPEFDEVEWSKLDPRQYDPRRIIREALLDSPDGPEPPPARDDPRDDDAEPATEVVSANSAEELIADRYAESAYGKRMRTQGQTDRSPYDPEST